MYAFPQGLVKIKLKYRSSACLRANVDLSSPFLKFIGLFSSGKYGSSPAEIYYIRYLNI